MPESLAPKLAKKRVPYDSLVLDPNNPRFITRQEDRIAEEHIIDQDLTQATIGKLNPPGSHDRYKIGELVNSIKQNGWLPVDYIFVRKLKQSKYFMVLEGNRRVAAIRLIMQDNETEPTLRETLKAIDVMEVLDSGSAEDLQKKITYLLGVRHHGSLKKWTPFAQAHNVFVRYLEIANQTADTFEWNSEYGDQVAATLSIQPEEVQERLRVYRVMRQIGNLPQVKMSAGGIKDRYYSVIAEPLNSPRKQLGVYVKQDPKTFHLSDEGASRMNNLCHFDVPERGQAPLQSPDQWRYLDKILADEDTEKRDANLKKVEVEKKHPSDVWAERAMELSRLTWSKWLFQVSSILKTISLGDDFTTAKAKDTAERLVKLIEELDHRDLQMGE